VIAEPGIWQRAQALLPWLGVARPRPLPARRTVGLGLALVMIGVVLTPPALGGMPWTVAGTAAAASSAGSAGSVGFALAWWQLAGVFTLAGIFVFHVEINSEAHTFSLSEVPLVLGLFFSHPWELVLARLVGEAAVLVFFERQTPAKLIFNLTLFFAESTTALAIFHAVRGMPDPLHPFWWPVALVAVGAAALLGAVAVWAVIRLHAGDVSPRKLITAAAITATGNTNLALVAAVLLRADPAALILLLLMAAVIVAGYRGYTRLTRRYDGLEMLYQFTRITSGTQRPDQTMQRVLDEASLLLRTSRALIALYRPGEDTPWLFLTSPASTPADPTGGTTTGEPAGSPTGAAGTATPGAPPGNLPESVRRDVLQQGRLLVIPRSTSDPADREVLTVLQAQDCIAAPLVSGGETSGVLVVCDRLGDVSTFDADDGRLFATLASQAAIALENGSLIERLQEQVQAREHEALHDALTGLPNRTLFSERLVRALEDPAARQVAVLLLDLDGFKEVNDTLGHHTGDQLLREVAHRLLTTVGGDATVARLGGDEFAVVLPRLPDAEAALRIARQTGVVLQQPVALASMALEIGASIGVALWPDHGSDPSSLLQRADVAMYTAKRSHAGVTLYDPGTDWNSQLRLRLAGELRSAILAGQIDVWYQPIARAQDSQVVGAEALVRWNHPELGRIGPDEFIPIAERTGLVHELTLYVLNQALTQAVEWRASGMEMSVAVNLPPQVLRDVDWSAKVADVMRVHGAEPDWLTFEITESGIMSDPERMITILDELAATGISFAIDDFGTGYSSLAYLQQLPVAKVKIDKSFVIPMVTTPGAAAIVRSVIDLARSLHLDVVAEGVEDQRTLDHLRSIDCTYVQGYYLSRPIPAAELTAWMRSRNVAATQR
jgi:diguanylate cyclase (GGDEF)-like protein